MSTHRPRRGARDGRDGRERCGDRERDHGGARPPGVAQRCPLEAWRAPALEAGGDPRPVCVVVDHVGDAYGYLARFIAALVTGLSDEQLELMDGRVRRLAAIGVRHADNHRAELEQGLAAAG